MSTDNLNSGGITTPRLVEGKRLVGQSFSTEFVISAKPASDKPEISIASESDTTPRSYKIAATTGPVPLSVGAPIFGVMLMRKSSRVGGFSRPLRTGAQASRLQIERRASGDACAPVIMHHSS